ncbi:MAG TPA: Eco29kI family restriction endonuclease [Pseudonocardiaceae bacterium]
MADDLLAPFSEQLRRFRAAKRLTTGQLATRCGLSRTTVSQALNARFPDRIPTEETFIAICAVLDADESIALDLLKRARAQSRIPEGGPRAPDHSRQFRREGPYQQEIELVGVFDPLRQENLERSVQWALEASPSIALTQGPATDGSGIYALYYTGSHDLYAPVASSALSTPLYVGGVTTGRLGSEHALSLALRRHCRSVQETGDLDAADFHVRYLPVADIWTGGATQLMIGDHLPVWNTVLAGFGNHAPGRARSGVRRSSWDEVHRGRPWAAKLEPGARTAKELRRAVRKHFAGVAVG